MRTLYHRSSRIVTLILKTNDPCFSKLNESCARIRVVLVGKLGEVVNGTTVAHTHTEEVGITCELEGNCTQGQHALRGKQPQAKQQTKTRNTQPETKTQNTSALALQECTTRPRKRSATLVPGTTTTLKEIYLGFGAI
jgi:hypothetical protein